VTFIVLTEQLPSGSSLARDFPYFIRGDDEGDALAPVESWSCASLIFRRDVLLTRYNYCCKDNVPFIPRFLE
jgi:hypothetical protein